MINRAGKRSCTIHHLRLDRVRLLNLLHVYIHYYVTFCNGVSAHSQNWIIAKMYVACTVTQQITLFFDCKHIVTTVCNYQQSVANYYKTHFHLDTLERNFGSAIITSIHGQLELHH